MSTAEYRSRNREYMCKYAKLHRNGYRLHVSALGTQRRLRALHAIGWTRPQLMELTGYSKSFLYSLTRVSPGSDHHKAVRVSRETDRLIKDLYRTLSVQPQHETPDAKKVRKWARKHGWAPPMSWDDIDDPLERPKGQLR